MGIAPVMATGLTTAFDRGIHSPSAYAANFVN
jgi:hypothetical protein